MDSTEGRLDQIRGPVAPRNHNARTIAALSSNPGCARRAIMDAAGVDKQRLAAHVGFPAPFGQSQFAITRGNSFEAQVKANGCAELVRLLRDHLCLPIPEVSYDNLDEVGGDASRELRHARTRHLLTRAAASGEDAGTLFDHPLLQLEVGGRPVYLEPDLIAFRLRGRFHVVEIKSFPVIDGQADGDKVAAAVIQSAVYVLALRQLLAESGIEPDTVADEVILVCPENFANRPTAAALDVRKQLTVLRRQLVRLQRIDDLLDLLPTGLTFDLDPGPAGTPLRPRPSWRTLCEPRRPGTHRNAWPAARCASSAGTRPAARRRPSDARPGTSSAAWSTWRRSSASPAAAAASSDQAEAAQVLRSAALLRQEGLGEAI